MPSRLESRLRKLESREKHKKAYPVPDIIICQDGETEEQAKLRYYGDEIHSIPEDHPIVLVTFVAAEV